MSQARADLGAITSPAEYGGGYLRVCVGDYRIIYTVKDDVLLVTVVRSGHRRDVYR